MINLNYKKYGESGEHLIIVHGLMGSLDNWNTLARKFADHNQVYSIDVRNHGRSPHTDEHNYDLIAGDILHFMEQQNIDSAHLLGHSMGGKAVMTFAREYSDRVQKLAVIDMALRKYPRGHDYIFAALNALKVEQLESRTHAADELSQYIQDAAVVQFLLKNLGRSIHGFKWRFNLDTLQREYENILAPICFDEPVRVPTIFIRGGRSGYVRDEDLEDIKSWFPNVTIDTIEGTGHWVHAENPKLFYQFCRNFFDQ